MRNEQATITAPGLNRDAPLVLAMCGTNQNGSAEGLEVDAGKQALVRLVQHRVAAAKARGKGFTPKMARMAPGGTAVRSFESRNVEVA